MHNPAYVATVLAAAKLASANVLDGRANITPSPVTDDEPQSTGSGSFSLDPEQACVESVISIILPESLTTVVDQPWADDFVKCTVTAPAGSSNVISTFMSQMTEWAESVKDVAVSQTDCGVDDLVLSYPQPCPSGYVFVFEGGEFDGGSNSYGPIPFPSGNITVGAEYTEAKPTDGSGASGSIKPTPSTGPDPGPTPKPTPSGSSGSNNEGGEGNGNGNEDGKGNGDDPKGGAATRVGGMVGATVALAGVLAAVLAL